MLWIRRSATIRIRIEAHIEDGNDGWVVSTDDVGDVLSLGHLGRYQLRRESMVSTKHHD